MTDVLDQNNPDVSENGDSELKERFETIKKELLEVWGPEKNDDEVEIEQWTLDWKFAEFLLKNESCLTTLKTYVKTIKRDSLSKKAWKSLKELEKFLDDIWDTERMKKDYDEFMEKIQKPKKLNTMKSREIRRLNIYLWAHEDDALAAYNAMKPIYGKYDENKMKSEDRRFFEEIWENLKVHYADSDKFFESDFGELSDSKDDLYNLAWNLWVKQWDGRNLQKSDVTIWDNSIVSGETVITKFNEANENRINLIKTSVISLIPEIKDQLWLKWGKVIIKSSWEELTSDSLLNLLRSKESFKNLPVVENERNTDHLKNILTEIINWDEIKDGLEDLSEPVPEPAPEPVPEPEPIPTTVDYEAPKDSFKIKLSGLKEKIKELGFYDGNEDGETIKFDISKVKEYLEWLKDKSWKELEVNTTTLDRASWTIAVQIALNYLSTKDGNSSFNVQWLDGIRGSKTKTWVRAFQEKFWLKKDWLPGKETITKLVEELKIEPAGNGWNEWDDWNWWNDGAHDDEATIDWDNETEQLNATIKQKIDGLDLNNPVLDLSALTSLSENDADQILKWINDKLNGQTPQNPILLKLNWLSSLDTNVAGKLSKFNWWIMIDKILNSINFDSCDSEIAMLKTLAPETNDKIKIISPTQEICDKLKEKGVKNVEVAQAS